MERQEIIKFLKNPKNYPHQVKKVKHISTYISDVFLTGKYAYKIKKPVDYGYLDFSTLAKRKFFVNQELKLNRRLSAQMYLSALPIVELKGKIKLSGKGKIIDYVLKMKEIPQQYLMYKQIKKRKVNKKIINKLAKIVAGFHKRAKTSHKILTFGSLETIKKNWQENFIQTKPFINKTISFENWRFIKKTIEKFIIENKELFSQRIKDKKIKDCHGDLHVGNIFLLPNKINVFDCIEFNERFRYQDTISDIANLLFGIDKYDKSLANYFFERYINYSGDRINNKLFSFYKCYRAYIMGKVVSFSLNSKELTSSQRKTKKEIAKKALKWARKYAEEIEKPTLIIGAGLPGVGRSTRLKFLAPKIKAKILDSDIIRCQMFKKNKYNKKNKLLVYKKMIQQAELLLKSGKNVILDATFSKKEYRKLLNKLTKKIKVNFYFIEFYCSPRISKKRLLKRAKKKSASDADWSIYLKAKKEFDLIKNQENYFRINTNREVSNKETLKTLKIFRIS